jgi:SOUL heme-binding protein
VEVRQYDPYLIAEVTFKKSEAGDMKAALSGGFRAIAGYIFDSKVRDVGDTSSAMDAGVRGAAWLSFKPCACSAVPCLRYALAAMVWCLGLPFRARGSMRRERRRLR